MRVLFAASECAPIAKVGGLADVVGSLPKALSQLGIDVAVALPNYSALPDNPPRVLPGSNVPIFYLGSRQDYPGDIYPGGYKEQQRFAAFCRQVGNFLDTRTFEPHVIHCHDYHTSLIPDILKERKEKIATVLTIHDAGNVGKADPSLLVDAGISTSSSRSFLRHSRENGNPESLDPRIRGDDTGGHLDFIDLDLKDRNIEFLLQGILSADVINTVSPTYAKEIMSREVSGDLAEVLKSREARVSGILNGIDGDFFDPRTDPNIAVNFGPGSTAAKRENKAKLQEKLGLQVNRDAPLYGLVSRLVERKGLDLVIKNIQSILGSGAQLVVLGKGDAIYEETLSGLAKVLSHSLAFVNAFDETLSHQIYASSDFFLVPSRTEPCGLTQMIAMRYGSLPLVHATGGLADTVENEVTGFVFNEYSPDSFLEAAQKSLRVYAQHPDLLNAMVGKAMAKDFSWKNSAAAYVKLYEKAIAYNFGIARTGGGEVRERPVGGWTLLSEGRAKRPFDEASSQVIVNSAKQYDYTASSRAQRGDLNEIASGRILRNDEETELEKCPFEEGHESMCPGELFRIGGGEPDTPGWEVRVIPNKFPLVPAHEVVVLSPDHNKDIDDLPALWAQKIVWAYLSRYRHYEDLGYVHIFCNHGQGAAASLSHPHSQIVVLDRLPDATVGSLEAAGRYYERHRRCPYCDSLERELTTKNHLVWQNDLMVVATPYASDWPYELTIMPKTHRQSFGNIKDNEIKDLAEALQISLKLLKTQYPNLSYNYWIHSVPELLGFSKTALYYHWHLDIAPRVKPLGGLELGAGVMVDDLISPEKAAAVLRGQLDTIKQ